MEINIKPGVLNTTMHTIDEEWTRFLSGKIEGGGLSCVHAQVDVDLRTRAKSIDLKVVPAPADTNPGGAAGLVSAGTGTVKSSPKCEELYISTQTKVLFLNKEVDIHRVFWDIPILPYWTPGEGVVKKQMKIVSKTPEEYEAYRQHLDNIPYYTEHVIKQINNPSARRLKFKDERKITVGISRKDIMNCRGKVKNAFYNCFALIFRFHYDGEYREIHVKVFNTGKMEIPGILNAELLVIMREKILELLRPLISPDLAFLENEKENSVLINSNFNCGYFIHRERLYAILRSEKYDLESSYDPCSYPGIKCKFYFNHDLGFDPLLQTGKVNSADRSLKMSELGDSTKYTEVSFMIFRTGSCLIVGNCTEQILRFIYDVITKILHDEYDNICVLNDVPVVKNKKMKQRKKSIVINV